MRNQRVAQDVGSQVLRKVLDFRGIHSLQRGRQVFQLRSDFRQRTQQGANLSNELQPVIDNAFFIVVGDVCRQLAERRAQRSGGGRRRIQRSHET